jgi:hypothetical protein
MGVLEAEEDESEWTEDPQADSEDPSRTLSLGLISKQVVSELSQCTSTPTHGGRTTRKGRSSSVTRRLHLIRVMSLCCTFCS